MYLKALEIIGFKSFADRTRLEFHPGLTSIIGPNGCGKSNVSDAIRWVLGEQSAKSLRGSKMEDCIFNGTEKRKPLAMAEVSLILANCEEALQTEYNEVTITRRVFRSGEGQYFINKVPCRLRDIQRLFMDTGIGTNSYSLMEQGRIDLILSSRPEDRRLVFEEISGITKYKADKREALRKLDHTEANLLRLADIIREVRRQMISLQRQAGKAARYKKHKDELRGLDLYATREKLKIMDASRAEQESSLAGIREKLAQAQSSIHDQEKALSALRERLETVEQENGTRQKALLELTTQRERSQQIIQNGENRIQELERQLSRDIEDTVEAEKELAKTEQKTADSQKQLAILETEYLAAQTALKEQAEKLAGHERLIAQTKQSAAKLLAKTMEQENQLALLQNDLRKLDQEEYNLNSRRERYAAEQENLKLLLNNHEKRVAELALTREQLSLEQKEASQALSRLQEQQSEQQKHLKETEKSLADARAERAAAIARMEILERNVKTKSGFSKTARRLLEGKNLQQELQQKVLGALASQIEAETAYRAPLEAVLRTWMDAIVLQDLPAIAACLNAIEPEAEDTLHLLSAVMPQSLSLPALPNVKEGVLLREHVHSSPSLKPLLDYLLHGVIVVEDWHQITFPVHPALTYATAKGIIARGDGSLEIYRGTSKDSNPLANKHLLAEQQEKLAKIDAKLEKLQIKLKAQNFTQQTTEKTLLQTRSALAEKQQALARQEGECQLVNKQANQTRQNLETVIWEARELEEQISSSDKKADLLEKAEKIRVSRQEIKQQIETNQKEQTELEATQRTLADQTTAARIQFAKQEEARSFIKAGQQPLLDRARQLKEIITERQTRAATSQKEIERVQEQLAQAQADLPELNKIFANQTEHLARLQSLREQSQYSAKESELNLQKLREKMSLLSRQESEVNGKCVEQRLQRQHLIERVTNEYRISADAMQVEPEPDWPGQKPPLDTLDETIAELRSKLDSMGPVNTEAIAEYTEQEERYQFLNQQQDDLIKSKQQLLEMIKTINQTTTEMFAQTFEAINNHFQVIYKRLFGGGSAKLMLADDEDILECGIEIIARPPGKKLQNISLLSGGERTMTAVALLFAFFTVKPSPFCVLDELDASLDESNIHRFIQVLKNFLDRSQFIVITHNRATISAANILYGVTMAETGVSKIVSMRFVDKPGEAEGELVAQENGATPNQDPSQAD